MLQWLQQWRIGLQAKVMIPVIGILTVVLGITLWLVVRDIQKDFREVASERLTTAQAVFRNSQQIRVKNLQLRFRSIPNEPRFKAVAQLQDPSTFNVLLHELLEEHGAEMAAFHDTEGKLYAAFKDPRLSESEWLNASRPILNDSLAHQEPQAGLAFVQGELYDIVSIPGFVGNHLKGVLIFGVRFGSSVAQEFKQLTHAEVIFVASSRITSTTLPWTPESETSLGHLLAASSGSDDSRTRAPQEITVGTEHFLTTSGALAPGLTGNQLRYLLLLSDEKHRSILSAIQQRTLCVGLVGIIVSISILWWVIQSATGPLRLLRDTAERIGKGDFSGRVQVHTKDECGELAAVFNQMTENLNASRHALQEAHDSLERNVELRTNELRAEINRREQAQKDAEDAHRHLVVASRLAGMAEVATSVLHNVGNVLNSVNISTTIVSDRLEQSRVVLLRKSMDLMLEHQKDLARFLTEDPKGSSLVGFMDRLSRHLETENRELRSEIQSVSRHVEHIKQIVATQQSFGKIFGVAERLNPRDLLDDALKLSAASVAMQDIEVKWNLGFEHAVIGDRHKVLQILVNLLCNAKQAIVEAHHSERCITIQTLQTKPNYLGICIRDTGTGISAENLDRIFRHGFTTKKHGHGFGLHASVLLAREMNGDLQVHSAGLGLGASFTLELPLAPSTEGRVVSM